MEDDLPKFYKLKPTLLQKHSRQSKNIFREQNQNESLINKKSVNHSMISKSSKTNSLPDILNSDSKIKTTSRLFFKCTQLPNPDIKKKANQIITQLLDKTQGRFHHANYKKIKRDYLINEKAFSDKVLFDQDENSMLVSSKVLSNCFGNEELKKEKMKQMKLIIKNRNYHDIDIIPYEVKKSADLRDKFDFSFKRNFYFGSLPKRSLIKYHLYRDMAENSKVQTFDEKMTNMYKSCKNLLCAFAERKKDTIKKQTMINGIK